MAKFLFLFLVIYEVLSSGKKKVCPKNYYKSRHDDPNYINCSINKRGWKWSKKEKCYACIERSCVCKSGDLNYIPKSLCENSKSYKAICSPERDEWSGDSKCCECIKKN